MQATQGTSHQSLQGCQISNNEISNNKIYIIENSHAGWSTDLLMLC